MAPSTVAQQIIRLAEAWAQGRRGQVTRSQAIVAFVEAVADLDIEMFEEDGEVYWKLPNSMRVTQ